MNNNKSICEILGIKYPIFQGAMAWISDGELAGAVSNAGGLGIIAGGNAPREVIEIEIKKAQSITSNPFAVNIMLLSPFASDIVDIVCELGVKVVTTGAGTPSKYMEKFNENGVSVIPVVPSVAIAKKMEKLGAVAVVVEGMESGGHIGKLTTMTLLSQVVDAISIPVIGAGGIGDGRGMAACFMLGAKGVQIGTRFLVAKECTVHQNYKNAILGAKDIDTIVTGQITGHPVRVLRNKLSRQYEAFEKEEMKKDSPDIEKIEQFGEGALHRAARQGDMETGSIMAGQISGLISKEQSAKEIIEEIMLKFNTLMNN